MTSLLTPPHSPMPGARASPGEDGSCPSSPAGDATATDTAEGGSSRTPREVLRVIGDGDGDGAAPLRAGGAPATPRVDRPPRARRDAVPRAARRPLRRRHHLLQHRLARPAADG